MKGLQRAVIRFLILVAFILLAHPLLVADPHSARTFFPHFYSEQKEIWTFPLHKESWKNRTFWLVLGLSTTSFTLDGKAAQRLREDPSFSDFNDVFASSTSDVLVAVAPLVLVAAGEISRDAEFRDFGWKAGEAGLNGFLVSAVWKAATQRGRPHEGKTYGFWEGGNSFPSGHATVAWALAATTASHFKGHKWVPWVVYPVAGLVSFSRVSSGNHFPSDAVFGSVLGFVIGRHVVH
ncbi:MAG: phosphatase PAP2 family protein [Acidobacteria bacterium]|nr:MAG: phosphatase PAP2 family protein [Acidobacteriota bacterium]